MTLAAWYQLEQQARPSGCQPLDSVDWSIKWLQAKLQGGVLFVEKKSRGLYLISHRIDSGAASPAPRQPMLSRNPQIRFWKHAEYEPCMSLTVPGGWLVLHRPLRTKL
jgi:hypothetical protein